MLKRIREIGLDSLFKYYAVQSKACREAVKALGLDIFPERPSESLTVIKVPEGINTVELLGFLRNKLGIVFAGGQDHLKGKIIRITHMGDQSLFDLLVAISALEIGLNFFGYSVELGKGVKVAEEIIYHYIKTDNFR